MVREVSNTSVNSPVPTFTPTSTEGSKRPFAPFMKIAQAVSNTIMQKSRDLKFGVISSTIGYTKKEIPQEDIKPTDEAYETERAEYNHQINNFVMPNPFSTMNSTYSQFGIPQIQSASILDNHAATHGETPKKSSI